MSDVVILLLLLSAAVPLAVLLWLRRRTVDGQHEQPIVYYVQARPTIEVDGAAMLAAPEVTCETAT